MVTYEDNNYKYWFDTHIKMWSIYQIDNNGNQIGICEYYGYKAQLLKNYPGLKFNKIK